MKTKKKVGIALLALFAVTFISGILLYLKSFGIVIQPRSVLKIVHWVLGYGMAVLFFVHRKQFSAMLVALRQTSKWFYLDTWLLILLFMVTFLSGTVKLLSPVRIPYLGLWHLYLGIAMSVAAIFHLFRGLPALLRR